MNVFEEIEKTNTEIVRYQAKLEKLKKGRLMMVMVSLVFILLFPILPGRYGDSWIDDSDYFDGVLFAAICALVFIPVIYLVMTFKYKRYIKRLLSYKNNLESKI